MMLNIHVDWQTAGALRKRDSAVRPGLDFGDHGIEKEEDGGEKNRDQRPSKPIG